MNNQPPWIEGNNSTQVTPTQSPTNQTTVTKPLGPVGKVRPSLADTIHVSLRGRVGNNIDYYTYPSGAVSARFRMAVSKKGRDELNQWHDLGATWYTVRVWGKLADNVQRSLRKGDPVLVSGRLEINSWQNEEKGQHGVELVIVADSLGHDLNFGMSAFNRITTPEQMTQNLSFAGETTGNRGTVAGETEPPVSQQPGVSQLAQAGEEVSISEIAEEMGVEPGESVLI